MKGDDRMAFVPRFIDAEREQCKASIMIEGLTGQGKSGLALAFGYILSGKQWDKVYFIDTENRSGLLLRGIPFSVGEVTGKFKYGELTKDIGYKPSNYTIYREAAKKAGALVVIKDSISHAWQYKGGVLDLVNAAAKKLKNNDKYGAWRDETVAAEKLELLELIRDPQVHVITTVRVKEGYEYVDDGSGGKKLQSVGMQQIQQDELQYEPDLVLRMVSPGYGTDIHPVAKVVKSRYPMLIKGETYTFTPELMLQVKVYLEEGADPLQLLEQQRQDYIQAVTEYLNSHPNAKPIWDVMKKDAGHGDTKLTDIPLGILKKLYITLTS